MNCLLPAELLQAYTSLFFAINRPLIVMLSLVAFQVGKLSNYERKTSHGK